MAEHKMNPLKQTLQRFSEVLTDAERQAILDLQAQPLPTGIRINRLRSEPRQTIQKLSAKYGWQAQPIPFCDNGWVIQKSASSPGVTIEHRMGQYYLQDAASMVPVSLFDLKQTQPLVLDMAASPGGKTTHLIDRTLDRGFILANDSSKGRMAALRSVLSNWGAINFATTNYPGEAFGSWFPETFDFVMLDAPCSMENLRPTPNHPMRETTSDERIRLQERQVQLLTSGLKALKTGGELVYATCSLAPEEDEAVIDGLMKALPNSFEIADVAKNFEFISSGLTQFKGETYHPDLALAVRLWPHLTGMSGFFCAKLLKTNSIPTESTPPPNRHFSLTSLERLATDLRQKVFDQISINYGVSLSELLDVFDLELYRRHDQFFLIPQRYLDHFINLPFAFIGMCIGRWLGDALEPSHEFISRFGHTFTRGIIQIENFHVDQWISGRDIRTPVTKLPPEGQYLLVTDQTGLNLGLGKLLPKRLRNMLPRGII